MSIQSILLVEDCEDDCEVIVRGFKDCNLLNPIVWFKNAQAALDYLLNITESLPGLILLDLNLPGLDGRSFLDSVKQNSHLKTIPIIILTTSSDQKDINICYEQGVNSYIQKPVNFQQMKKVCEVIHNYWFNICLLPNPTDN